MIFYTFHMYLYLSFQCGTSHICCENCPNPCGLFTGQMIFRHQLRHELNDNELVMADNVYTDENFIRNIPVN